MKEKSPMPHILEEERTSLVEKLLDIIKEQQNQIDNLKEEINRLKKHPKKPELKPNTLPKENTFSPKYSSAYYLKNKGKKHKLTLHREVVLKPLAIPVGARFKGYKTYLVQDVNIKLSNTQFKLERWQMPDGKYLSVSLPQGYQGYHFGPTLRAYILHQYHHQGVTQRLLLSQLREWGILISAGQLNALLVSQKEKYHLEKAAIYRTAIRYSDYLHVDDTSARHKGKNGVCTHLGNQYFAVFLTSRYKNRINFLTALHQAHPIIYEMNTQALSEMKEKGLEFILWFKLSNLINHSRFPLTFSSLEKFKQALKEIGFERPAEYRIAIEAAIKVSLKRIQFPENITLVSDAAGQFETGFLPRALCWIHLERNIKQLIPETSQQVIARDDVLERFWTLYRLLLYYKKHPQASLKADIEQQFAALCEYRSTYKALTNSLKKFAKHKPQLLRVLENPKCPLHNNLSENDIRTYVTKRKISFGTRSDAGRDCRDTFTSLKKTCQKLDVAFWNYLLAREGSGIYVPSLTEAIVRAHVRDNYKPQLMDPQVAITSTY